MTWLLRVSSKSSGLLPGFTNPLTACVKETYDCSTKIQHCPLHSCMLSFYNLPLFRDCLNTVCFPSSSIPAPNSLHHLFCSCQRKEWYCYRARQCLAGVKITRPQRNCKTDTDVTLNGWYVMGLFFSQFRGLDIIREEKGERQSTCS